MKNIELHICITGLHFMKSYDNIEHLIERIQKYKNITVKINMIHDTTDLESYKLKKAFNKSKVGSIINWVEYESKFLKSGRDFKSMDYASLIMQHEPLEHYLSLGISANDYIFRCRGDYYLTDEFLKMILDEKFYLRLDNKNDNARILNSKIWLPYIGKSYFLNFCDYFFILKASCLKDILITDNKEASLLWNDPYFNKDRKCFVERLFFTKPLFDFMKRNNINSRSSEGYWDVLESNFCYGGDPSPIKTCFYGWRKSAWQGLGNLGIKFDSNATSDEIRHFTKTIEKYSKIPRNKVRYALLSQDRFKF